MLFSQINIESADISNAGDAFLIYHAAPSSIEFMDPESETGADYTWDFSDLINIFQTESSFISVLDTPQPFQLFFNSNSIFPEHISSHARGIELPELIGIELPLEVTDAFEFYRNDDNGYYNTGYAAYLEGFPLAVQRNPVDVIYNFPVNYGNIDSSYSSFLAGIPLLGVFGQDQIRINEVDGWGQIYTPAGTFEALRVKTILNISDTVNIPEYDLIGRFERPETIEYKWLAPDEKIPVFQIISTAGVITSISYKSDEVINGMEAERGKEDIELFPNPADNYTMISTVNWNEIKIFDIKGGNVRVDYDMNNRKINTINLNNGLYFIHLVNDNEVRVLKLMVHH